MPNAKFPKGQLVRQRARTEHWKLLGEETIRIAEILALFVLFATLAWVAYGLNSCADNRRSEYLTGVMVAVAGAMCLFLALYPLGGVVKGMEIAVRDAFLPGMGYAVLGFITIVFSVSLAFVFSASEGFDVASKLCKNEANMEWNLPETIEVSGTH
ncbi:hypothetical protein [Tropicimonas sp.]|uniref:hypothetical protein n=1 Tax=Tropicimonas sp. TaxID=2067044 RepID=UPI003A844A6D